MLSADVTLGRRSALLMPIALAAAVWTIASLGRPSSDVERFVTAIVVCTAACLPWDNARKALSKSGISTREYCANE